MVILGVATLANLLCGRAAVVPAACIFVGMLTCILPGISSAAYPERPIRIIYPWPAGSGGDVATRVFADELGKKMGASVVVENKPGADGIIGTQYVAGSSPEGYTLLMTTSEPLVINPNIYATLPYKIDADFDPIAFVGRTVFVMAASAPFAADDVPSLLALAKKDPGKYSVATYGIADMFLASLESVTRTEFLRVPFQGGGPAMASVVGGHVNLTLVPSATAVAQLPSGKIKLLGVGSAKRIASLPAVPTFAEQGLASFEIGNWLSILGPKGLPADVKATLQKAISEIAVSPAFAERVSPLGIEVEYMAAEKYRDYLRSESQRWGTIVRDKHIPMK